MTPYYTDDAVTLYYGDCLDVLAQLPDASVDSVVTDPPYGLDFMGKHWDTGAVAFDTAVWGHCLRVLKPGGHLLAFGGTRTWHRLACAVEDAGFEIRDSIAWLYGSGFPKSLNVGKAIDSITGADREEVSGGRVAASLGNNRTLDGGKANPNYAHTKGTSDWEGWGTALKPAFEPVVVGRKPLSGTVAGNVLAHGVGALNVDGCRVGSDERTNRGMSSLGVMHDDDWKPREVSSTVAGRWPSNVVIDPETAEGIDRQSGGTPTGDGALSMKYCEADSGDFGILNDDGWKPKPRMHPNYNDNGGASRFFPTFRYQAKAPTDERPTANGIAHPTVKPLNLMRWLVRLVTPAGGLVLEPFAGSGTTAEACIHEHMRCIAIERESDYLPLIVARLSKPIEIGFDFEVGA
jgi:site-specific DNA-methyltransferase (adenine-specific)